MNLFESWPHMWFGLWKLNPGDDIEAPLFKDIVDTTWVPEDLDKLVGYLEKSPLCLVTSRKEGKCFLCGVALNDPNTQRGDGVWIWPGILGHYVKNHHVRLPDKMVTHIRSQKYLPPIN